MMCWVAVVTLNDECVYLCTVCLADMYALSYANFVDASLFPTFSFVLVSLQDETDPDELRRFPFGYDSTGRLYYRLHPFRKEMRVYR